MPRLGERLRRPRARAELDDVAALEPAVGEERDDQRPGLLGELEEAGVVDVGEILAVSNVRRSQETDT